ncbi:MAG: glucosaminidase domain-containing protein [Halothece sp.]
MAETEKFRELINRLFDNRSFPESLKTVVTAQWMLESNRGNSDLAVKHNNFAGLKWRKELEEVKGAKPVDIKVPSETQLETFAAFDTPEAFVNGYIRFINRTPYKGWEAYATEPMNYIKHIHDRGYATDPNYVSKVERLIPEAQALIISLKTEPIVVPQPQPSKGDYQTSLSSAATKAAELLDSFFSSNKTSFSAPELDKINVALKLIQIIECSSKKKE